MTSRRYQCAHTASLAFAMATVAVASPAFAQQVDIEVPVLILDTADGGSSGATDEDLDLANIVQTAAKGVTTIQEAPAIVTVVTDREIEERGITRLDDVFDTVPGWLRHDAIHNQFPFGLTRGTIQAMLYMQDGVSMFDPAINTPNVGRLYPIEMVKRVEMITGPGGVLWGANSYLGVVNVITKLPEDVDGVEAGVRVGGGPGDRGAFRGYLLAGLPELLGTDMSGLLHTSFETFQGPSFEMPQVLFNAPTPAPNAPLVYGPLTSSEQPQSMLFQVNGKLTVGELAVAFHAPLVVEHHQPLGFNGSVSTPELAEDMLRDSNTGELLCPPVEPFLPDGSRNPDAFSGADQCSDRGRIGRGIRLDSFDRYAVARYQTRFFDDRASARIRVYASQFTRQWKPNRLITPNPLLEGGLGVRLGFTSFRIGAAYDGDLELSGDVRVLYGGEAFREWLPDETTSSRQGAGQEGTVLTPYDLSRLALPCPFRPVEGSADQIERVESCPLTLVFETDRTVLGAYLNPQWRLNDLTLDGGVRIQAAPAALSDSAYDAQLILSGSAVYNFARNWHAKLNYAEGFRPPVFNNTRANSKGLQIGSDPDLEVEDSQSIQGEINARVFAGKRSLREVSFRADYSYTKLENLIQIFGSEYRNAGDRGIHSAEFLGKIYLKGRHRVELGYTWLKIATDDRGYVAVTPEHWFNLTGVFSLVPDTLVMSSNIKILGAMEDPNRIVEHRPVQVDPETGVLPQSAQLFVQPHELALDRLPPAAVLTVGLTWLDAFGVDALYARAFVHNAFNTRHYNPDGFGDYEPRNEFLPNPYPDLRVSASMAYRY